MKQKEFLHIAALLNDVFHITPLLFGSLGLEKRLKMDLSADDIDILIPENFLESNWGQLIFLMEKEGYKLYDEKEHAFSKLDISIAYATINTLKTFADIDIENIPVVTEDGISYYLLELEDYLKVYKASSKDSYRQNIKNKQDKNKIDLIKIAIKKKE